MSDAQTLYVNEKQPDAGDAATDPVPDFYGIFKGYEQLLVAARESIRETISAIDYIERKMLAIIATVNASKKFVFAAPISMAVLSGNIPVGRKWCVLTLVVAVVLAAAYTAIEHVLHKELSGVRPYSGVSITQAMKASGHDGVQVANHVLPMYRAFEEASVRVRNERSFALSHAQRAHALVNYGRDGLLAASSAIILWLLVR